jgi:predicted N-acetyltransferase YhbS
MSGSPSPNLPRKQAIMLFKRAKAEIIMLFANPGKEPFYARFGFRKMKTALALMDNPGFRCQQGLIE